MSSFVSSITCIIFSLLEVQTNICVLWHVQIPPKFSLPFDNIKMDMNKHMEKLYNETNKLILQTQQSFKTLENNICNADSIEEDIQQRINLINR